MTGPLSGLKVLELGRVLAAPYAAQILKDLGAEVTKIERPEGGDESRAFGDYYFRAFNRGKASVFLDLKSPAGKADLTSRIRGADVLVHNWAPGSLEALGFGPEACLALNPRLVYCAVSGFDADPRPALDLLAQAASGLMALTGPAGGDPVRAGVPISDLAAGLYAAVGILAALQARQATGKGQVVRTSLMSSSLALLSYQATRFAETGKEPKRLGNAHPSIVPYDGYRTSDGFVVLMAANDAQFRSLAGVLGHPEWTSDPRFVTNALRCEHRKVLEPALAKACLRFKMSELEALCLKASVPCGPVRTVGEALGGLKTAPFPVRIEESP